MCIDRNSGGYYNAILKEITAVDLTATCDIRHVTRYRYDLLERLDHAANLIARLAGAVWRTPDEFEIDLDHGTHLALRWRATSDSCGLATVFDRSGNLSVSLLCAGINAEADQATLQAFQTHVVRELHDTPHEPSFAVLQITDRPLLATLGLFAPQDSAAHPLFALADRCFAAAYFRKLGLA